jgi:hypothetical protein
MKFRPFSLTFLFVCLMLVFAWLVVQPPTTIAATGTADCAGGTSVTCNAYRCDCENNVGCTGYDSSGNVVSSQTHACSGGYAPMEP